MRQDTPEAGKRYFSSVRSRAGARGVNLRLATLTLKFAAPRFVEYCAAVDDQLL
jgi:hypothetical protein